MSKADKGEISTAEAAPQVLEALRTAYQQAREDLFGELDPGEFFAPGGALCEVVFTGEGSRPGAISELYGYVAAEVKKSGKQPVTVGVLLSDGGHKGIIEFSKRDKYWKYGSGEPRPKFVDKTLARLGISSL